MIRVLHVVTYMGRGGLETMLMNYYRYMDRKKVQFDFLVHREFEADYDKEILALGGRIYHISRLVPWSASYRRELRAFFRAHPEYKIVHVHQDCLSSVALECARECGVPVRIGHSHSSSAVKNLKYPIKRYYMRGISRAATDLFACGKTAGDWMFGGAEYRILPNAVDMEQFSFSGEKRDRIRAQLGLRNALAVGHVGNFHPGKNHSFLLDVFAAAAEQEPRAKLVLAGDGPLRREMEEKAKKLGLSDRVQFLGIRKDVAELMMGMDVFVFPSKYEGLPVALIEAQASGLPCLISDGVSREAALSETLVFFEKCTSAPALWAERLLAMASCDTSRRSRNRDGALQAYDIKENAKKLEGFYLERSKQCQSDHIHPCL